MAPGPVGRRGRGPLLDPLLPLINVVFLLLVFVMATTAIAPRDVLRLVLPLAVTAPDARQGQLVLRMDGTGRLELAGRALDHAAVLAEVRRRAGGAVLLEADGRLGARNVLRLANGLRDAGAGAVKIAVRRR